MGVADGSVAGVGAVRDRVVLVDAAGRDVGDCDGDGTIDEAAGEAPALVADDALYDASYAWIEARRDGSRSLHDPRGLVRSLQDALLSLAAARPTWDRPSF